MKIQFIVYAEIKSLLDKIDTCHSNPEKSSTTKINKHAGSGCSLFTHYSFDSTENNHDFYRGKDCMKNFSRDLKKHVTKIRN